MRNRRRHLVGFSVAALLRSPPRRPLPRRRPELADAVPSLASPSQKPFIAPQPRPTEAPRPADRRPRPQPQRLHGARRRRARPPAAPTSASTGWPRASTRPSLDRLQRRRRPRLRRAGAAGSPNTCTRSRTTSSAGASRRATAHRGGGNGKTDIYLSQIGGELFGYAAPDRGQATKQHRIPRRLHGYLVLDNDYSAFEFPGTTPAARPRGDARPRVQPHPPVRLRRLPGPLVRRVDRDLDGGPGLQRHQRLPALRAPLGAPLGNAADHQLDQGVRLGGLEPVAGAPLRRLDRPQGLGAGDPRPARAASRSTPTNRRSAPPGRSDFGHDFARFAAAVAEWRTGRGFRESRLYPDMPRQGTLPLDGQPLTRLLNHTTFAAAAGAGPARPRRRRPRGRRRAGPRPAWRWSAGSAASASGHTVTRLDFSRGGGTLTVRLARPAAASAASPPSSSTPTPRPTASAPAGSTGAT